MAKDILSRVAEKLGKGQPLKLPEAVAYLENNNTFYSETQLRNWYRSGRIVGHQPVKGSPLLISRGTLDKLISGELPK